MFSFKQPYLCWLHSRLEYSSSNVCYQWSPRNIHPPHVMIVTRDTSSPSEWQVRLLGKMFEEKRTKWCLRLALWMNFISTSSNSITRDWSYFHHIWDFLVSKLQNMCRDFRDAVDLEKQTNAGAIRRLENKTWGFFWIRWCCRHFLPFQLCHNNMTTISKQCKARVMSSNDNGQQCSISYKQVLLGLLCYFFILTTSRF